ncbi:MAG TPA: plasmid replication protein, CyRepA1 family [Allocoleopsis sp.]
MLQLHHLQEFLASAIDPALAQLNFHSTDDNWFIRQWLNWKPNQKWQHCPFDSGWFCYSLDPRTGESRRWGPLKPDSPIVDTSKGKPRKYEHPAGYETLAILLQPDEDTWAKIAQRYRVPFTPLSFRLRDRNPHPHFWEWVWTYNLPIIICEGAKKAASLLSAGYVAIALPGVWNGRKKRQGNKPERLIPDLQYFTTPGREVFFCFDHDPKLKTRIHVSHALVRTGKLLEQAGCTVKVIRLPGPEKGVDDFIVGRGHAAFDHLYLDAVSLESYEQARRSWLSGHSLTYPIALDLNCRYLLDGMQQVWTAATQQAIEHLAEGLKSGIPFPTHSETGTTAADRPSQSGVSGVIAIASDMGTGKTEFLAQLKQAYPNARILNLGHRVALLRNLANRIGTAIYSDHGWNMWREQWLSLTADSLYKLKTEENIYDFIFLDEVEQFIQHVLCSDTCKGHRHEILQALKHFIYSAKCVILSDAHLSDISIQFILAMRPDPQQQPFVIRNRYRNGNRKVYWYEGKDRSGIVQAIKGSLFLGQKPIVACDGLEFSKDLYETLKTLYPEKNIVCINSENSGEGWAKTLIEKINQEVTAIDCLIYSPSVNTGVSIDVEQFDQVFGVFVGGSLAGTDCLQALNRYRPKVDWHVWVGDKPIGGYRPTSADRIQQNKLQENDLCGFLLGIVPGTGERVVQDEFAWNAWAKLTARRNESLNNLRGDVKYLLEQQGQQLLVVGEAVDAETQAELKQAREVNQQVRKQGILSADRISASVARQLEAKERPTLQDQYKLERYRIETSWGKEVDAELIDLDQGGRTIRQFLVLESMLEPPSEVQQVKGKRIFFPPELVAQRDRTEREKFHALDWRNYSVAWALRMELELAKFLNPEREFCNHDPDLIALQERVQKHALIVKDFLGITIRKNATPIRVLQQLLEQMGMKLSCVRKDGPRGEQVRVYRLSSAEWQLAQEVLEFRRLKRERQAQQPFEACQETVGTGGNLSINLIKGGDVTTEAELPLLPAQDVAEAIALIEMAIESGSVEGLRAVWECWDDRHKQQLWEEMSESLRREVEELLQSSGMQARDLVADLLLMPGTVVQWLKKAGIWIIRAVDRWRATIFCPNAPEQEWRVEISELKVLPSD